MQRAKKQYRSMAALIVLVIIASSLFLLWNAATIRPDLQPSFLPGPIWMLRFEALQKHTGLNAVAYNMVSVLVSASLVAGIVAVLFYRKVTGVVLSLTCLILWLLIGMAMQQVIASTLPLEPVEDQPGLPRVLLIGDSISIGYTLEVRHLLSGQANVHRANTNCGSTEKGLRLIDSWIGEGDWDVIHFNWGLHDLRNVNKNATDFPEPEVSLEAYEQNLHALVKRLTQTGAKLIWAATTPVLQSCEGCEPENVQPYNQVAARVMAENNIPTNNLFEFASPRLPEIQRRKDIHFTFDGYRQLGEQVAGAINRALNGTAADNE